MQSFFRHAGACLCMAPRKAVLWTFSRLASVAAPFASCCPGCGLGHVVRITATGVCGVWILTPDSEWYGCALRGHGAWGVCFQPEAVSSF